jgi:hypothetical protein
MISIVCGMFRVCVVRNVGMRWKRLRLTRDFGASFFCSLFTSTITITIFTSRLAAETPNANPTTHYRRTADDAHAEDSFNKVEARGLSSECEKEGYSRPAPQYPSSVD